MSERWVSTRTINRAANARAQRWVESVEIRSDGLRLHLSGGGWIYHPRTTSPGAALNAADDHGYSTYRVRTDEAERREQAFLNHPDGPHLVAAECGRTVQQYIADIWMTYGPPRMGF